MPRLPPRLGLCMTCRYVVLLIQRSAISLQERTVHDLFWWPGPLFPLVGRIFGHQSAFYSLCSNANTERGQKIIMKKKMTNISSLRPRHRSRNDEICLFRLNYYFFHHVPHYHEHHKIFLTILIAVVQLICS